VDIDPERIREAEANAKQAGVTDRVRFLQKNLFDADFHEATVVTLYLLPEVNIKLRPKLLKELKVGTRIVSHQFDMGEWKPDKQINMDWRTVYLLYRDGTGQSAVRRQVKRPRGVDVSQAWGWWRRNFVRRSIAGSRMERSAA